MLSGTFESLLSIWISFCFIIYFEIAMLLDFFIYLSLIFSIYFLLEYASLKAHSVYRTAVLIENVLEVSSLIS